MKKYFLVIDTSSTLGLCAIAEKDNVEGKNGGFSVISEKYINAESSHSEHLFINIQKVLSEAKIDFSQIDTVVYTAGPGSFTGLRIAYSAVKGFTTATAVKSHGVSTLKSLMYNIRNYQGYKVVMIKENAKNLSKDVYAFIEDDHGNVILNEGCYDVGVILEMNKRHCALGNKITVVGSGALAFKDLLIHEESVAKKVFIPESNLDGHSAGISGHDKDPHVVHPLGMLSLLEQKSIDDINYLKPSYAELKAMQK